MYIIGFVVASASAEQEVLGSIPRWGSVLSGIIHKNISITDTESGSARCPVDGSNFALGLKNHWLNMSVPYATPLPYPSKNIGVIREYYYY